MFIAQEDVRDFFQRLGMDCRLNKFLTLSCDSEKEIRKVQRGSEAAGLERLFKLREKVNPMHSVLSMAFSWSSYLAQLARKTLAAQTLPHTTHSQSRT